MCHSIRLALGLVRRRSFHNLGSWKVDKNHIGIDWMSRHQCALLACALGTSHRLFGIRTSLCISQLQLSSQVFFLGGLLRISAPWLPKVSRKLEQMAPKEVSKMLGYLKYQASPKPRGDSEAKSKADCSVDVPEVCSRPGGWVFEKVRVESTRSELGWRDCRRGKQFNTNQNKLP